MGRVHLVEHPIGHTQVLCSPPGVGKHPFVPDWPHGTHTTTDAHRSLKSFPKHSSPNTLRRVTPTKIHTARARIMKSRSEILEFCWSESATWRTPPLHHPIALRPRANSHPKIRVWSRSDRESRLLAALQPSLEVNCHNRRFGPNPKNFHALI